MKIKKILFLSSALGAALILSACSTVDQKKAPVITKSTVTFVEENFSNLPVSDPGAWASALLSFRQSCSTPMGKDAKWSDICRLANETSPIDARQFFYASFVPWQIKINEFSGQELVNTKATGLMTGYFESMLHGSRHKSDPYVHPLYGVPDDLLIIDLTETHPQLKGLRLRGKLDGRRVVPYDKRGAIQERKDMDQWALAWVDDPIESFFLHIQGSGRILLTDGSYLRIGFADQNGHQYRSIGNWLVRKGYLKRHELSMQRITAWAKANPTRVNEALAQNPSYVFFEERDIPPELGPIGAQGVPLTPLASVAIDPRYWRLGTPFIVSVNQDNPHLAFTRPVIAQDTGGAIKGVIRFDYFWGFGSNASAQAGRQKSRTEAWILVPKGLKPEDISKIH